ncbi:MAG: DUF3160 domain-containing protein [Lachnospiraceae bacterium]|nr:DUF3160 domain-containing protein [Lachnospiraceae bacterium]
MKKKMVACVLALILAFSGCAGRKDRTPDVPGPQTAENATDVTPEPQGAGTSTGAAGGSESASAPAESLTFTRTSFLGEEESVYHDPALVPQLAPYRVAEDFSNVVFDPMFSYLFYQEDPDTGTSLPTELSQALTRECFAVLPGHGEEFFDIYETNRYSCFPSFITVDSLMHTYHLYFAHLMKTCEKTYLTGELQRLSGRMLEISLEQAEALRGTGMEEAARRNAIFFAVGCRLQDPSFAFPAGDSEIAETAEAEVRKILDAAGIADCVLTGEMEDYTQYKPRGYYEGDEELERYFRAMMWYGRIPFVLEDAEYVKSALLQTAAISREEDSWESIYQITGFFAGASDDPGFFELGEIAGRIYGNLTDPAALSDPEKFDAFFREVQTLDPPQVNSIPVEDGENPVIPSYRFLGQRFTVDAAIMQKLVYSAVKENAEGQRRMLPDTLDTAAALGSKEALRILTEQGDTAYEGYTENLSGLMAHFDTEDPQIWSGSLYACWLNTLRPLLEEKGEGYPSYMQSVDWTRKNLETFAGSYAELKHDTILYAKQTMAEMGGWMEEEPDDRGYVDPQPVVYGRFRALSEKTRDGLARYGMLGEQAAEDLDRLAEIAGTLLSVSEKELRGEALSEADYEFIKCYGGYLEHFWKEASQDSYDGPLVYSYQAPCPVIADIATDPNGAVLEVGNGYTDTVYVVYPIGEELHVGRGSVYRFYQFAVPLDKRMTDSEWRNALSGGYIDENWEWIPVENPYVTPEWTGSYRVGTGF